MTTPEALAMTITATPRQHWGAARCVLNRQIGDAT